MAEPDADVIRTVLRGEVEHYAQLVDRYQGLAMKVAFSLIGNYEDAKDISQEAFVIAYQALNRFRGESRFSTWLYRIVINRCKDFYKHRARRPIIVASLGGSFDGTGDGLFVDMSDPAAGPSEQSANRELSRQLSGAIGALPMKQRTAFALHHLHGLSLQEVAAVMRCRIGTVKSHVFRATERLRRHLTPWGKEGH